MATYVLIHGAGSDSWYWHRVAPTLRALGHDVVAPDLPVSDDAAGLCEYADTVVDAIGGRTDLVVVAQSMGGFTAPLTYGIDLAQPVGSRITDLSYDGAAVDPTAKFVVAINNYRASGGGNFPATSGNPAVYNAQVEIRQLIIDWVTANGTIDPKLFHTVDWRLTYNGAPLQITP